MSEILLPRPDNIRGRFGMYVTHDVYHISERLQEIDKNLFIQAFEEPIHFADREYNFAIVEWVPLLERDELVMRVQELDARVIEACQRMLAIPFEKRFAEAEKEADKWAAEEKERQLDDLYEHMGGNMLVQLERCGFIGPRTTSYAKRNATARRHRSHRKGAIAGV